MRQGSGPAQRLGRPAYSVPSLRAGLARATCHTRLVRLSALALLALLASPTPARADSGWNGRVMPNVGITVAHRADGAADVRGGTSLGLEGSLDWFFASVVPTTAAREGQTDILHDFLIRLLALQVGADVNLDVADAVASGYHAQGRFSLGVHAGGFVGVDAGVDLRTAANAYDVTGSVHLGVYFCLGPFSIDVRVPVATGPLSGGTPYPEGVMLVVKLAPMPTLSLITDWKNPFNPEGG